MINKNNCAYTTLHSDFYKKWFAIKNKPVVTKVENQMKLIMENYNGKSL